MSQTEPTQSVTYDLIRGLFAGLVSTTAMSLVMLALYKRLPRDQKYSLPPEEIATVAEQRILRKHLDEDQHMAFTWMTHFGYGVALAEAYTFVRRYVPFPPLGKGVLYGLAVWLGSYMGWLPAFGVLRPANEFPHERRSLMVIAHVVWGATLGIVTDKLQEINAQK